VLGLTLGVMGVLRLSYTKCLVSFEEIHMNKVYLFGLVISFKTLSRKLDIAFKLLHLSSTVQIYWNYELKITFMR
jgi:hypothetical protein